MTVGWQQTSVMAVLVLGMVLSQFGFSMRGMRGFVTKENVGVEKGIQEQHRESASAGALKSKLAQESRGTKLTQTAIETKEFKEHIASVQDLGAQVGSTEAKPSQTVSKHVTSTRDVVSKYLNAGTKSPTSTQVNELDDEDMMNRIAENNSQSVLQEGRNSKPDRIGPEDEKLMDQILKNTSQTADEESANAAEKFGEGSLLFASWLTSKQAFTIYGFSAGAIQAYCYADSGLLLSKVQEAISQCLQGLLPDTDKPGLWKGSTSCATMPLAGDFGPEASLEKMELRKKNTAQYLNTGFGFVRIKGKNPEKDESGWVMFPLPNPKSNKQAPPGIVYALKYPSEKASNDSQVEIFRVGFESQAGKRFPYKFVVDAQGKSVQSEPEKGLPNWNQQYLTQIMGSKNDLMQIRERKRGKGGRKSKGKVAWSDLPVAMVQHWENRAGAKTQMMKEEDRTGVIFFPQGKSTVTTARLNAMKYLIPGEGEDRDVKPPESLEHPLVVKRSHPTARRVRDLAHILLVAFLGGPYDVDDGSSKV